MNKVVERIKEFRSKRNYTYENMAQELDITAGAYRKLEMNETKLTIERLYKIAEILEIKAEDLLDIKADKIFNQQVDKDGIGYQDNENVYADNKNYVQKIEQLYELRLKDKDDLINQLRMVIEKLSK
jgi:transcriptional regulator with XRE-family HTH domain